MTYFCKNHSEFGEYSVLAMCRVNDMANKIKLDPKSVVRKSVIAALTLRGEGIYTFSTGNVPIPSGEKKKTGYIGTVLPGAFTKVYMPI